MATFGDLMNLLLCFFVLLFSMSTIDAQEFAKIAASFNNEFSVFDGGATAIGEGILVSAGVSQLNELDEYINSTGRTAENEQDLEEFDEMQNEAEKTLTEQMEQAQIEKSEQLAEQIQEAVNEDNLSGEIDIQFTTQYVQLTLNGAILFDSGKAVLKEEVLPILSNVGVILERYAEHTIEIEGHTDNVPIHSSQYANNNELSSARALSVFDYFVDTTNLDPACIKTSGRGEYIPVADNSTAEGRAANRRVEIRIYHELSYY
jgi:chemotaxis protein MotB